MSQIRDLRRAAKLTQKELAAKIGISVPTLRKMERLETNEAVLKITFLSVCQTLGVSPDKINDVRVHGTSIVERQM
jgi:transcriptional regulator with XRE-family HTH domain